MHLKLVRWDAERALRCLSVLRALLRFALLNLGCSPWVWLAIGGVVHNGTTYTNVTSAASCVIKEARRSLYAPVTVGLRPAGRRHAAAVQACTSAA